ncbi:MAG: response regulator, partial [Haloplanus sp.]
MSLDVLVVEDSEFMRDLLAETLSDDHEVVATAENGVEAVELYEEHDPD